MSELTGKVAVVTGAASGIGFAVAQACVAEDMRVVLADVEEDALEAAADALAPRGKVLAVPTDVSQGDSVDDLRRQAEAFGAVRLLCNNAGVGGAGAGAAWQKPLSAWRWVLDVNLWGVINGIHAFLPGMVERDEGHIVNTASVAGLLPFPFAAPYAASKHAVVAISMSVQQELQMLGSNVRISALCPGWIRTRIADARRNWPDRYGEIPEATDQTTQMIEALARSFVEEGMDPSAVADRVLEAVREGRFWILPNAEAFFDLIKDVPASAVEGRDPPMAPLA